MSVSTARTSNSRRLRRAEARAGYLMLAPSLIGVGLFLVLPVLIVVALSLTSWDLLGSPQFIGLDNYRELLGSAAVWNSVWVTIKFTAMAIPATVIIGLIIALTLNRGLPGSSFFRLIFVLPWVCAPLALGVMWNWMFHPSTGLVNSLLGHRVEWMSNPRLALPAIAFVYVWQNIGYVSLFFLAGLQQIPESIYEAASLDGAGALRKTWSMTLPLLRPTTFFVLVTTIISSFQVFDLVYGLTGSAGGYPAGSTDVIAAHIYHDAFVSNHIGSASAIAVLLCLALVAITVAQRQYFAKRMTYDMS